MHFKKNRRIWWEEFRLLDHEEGAKSAEEDFGLRRDDVGADLQGGSVLDEHEVKGVGEEDVEEFTLLVREIPVLGVANGFGEELSGGMDGDDLIERSQRFQLDSSFCERVVVEDVCFVVGAKTGDEVGVENHGRESTDDEEKMFPKLIGIAIEIKIGNTLLIEK